MLIFASIMVRFLSLDRVGSGHETKSLNDVLCQRTVLARVGGVVP